LRHLDSKSKLDSFLVKSDATIFTSLSEIPIFEEKEEEQQSILQIQQILENEHVTKFREMEILKISKSILEMNGIFKGFLKLIFRVFRWVCNICITSSTLPKNFFK
jgi:hypothetical protein